MKLYKSAHTVYKTQYHIVLDNQLPEKDSNHRDK